MITCVSDHQRQLTCFTSEGPVRLTDVKKALKHFYSGQPTQMVIWDLTGADLTNATLVQVEELAGFIKGLSHSRVGGRNAIVASEPFAYSLGKMYQLFADLAQHTSQTRIFKTRPEAEEWLFG
jgi:hypothetical protein